MSAEDGVGPARVGIDFGTSSTVAVVVVPGREPRPLLFDGSPLLPSAVCVGPTGQILTGRDALHTAMAAPSAFDPHPKQRIDTGTVLLAGTEIEVTRLIGAVLGRVLIEAANAIGTSTADPPEVTVTCPAAWGNVRRGVLLAAAPPGTRLVEEPIAAAHYFVDIAGSQLPDGGAAVVYDFGAGTFDAAVVRRTGNSFTTVAARGVSDCGGLDIDAAIVAHLMAAGPDQERWSRLQNPATATDRRARQLLWENVRAGKEMLSRTSSTLIHLPLLDTEAPLGREELERLAGPVLDRTVSTVRDVLDAAGVRAADLSAIFLAGGSSRMPAVVTRLHRAFGIAPVIVDQPELAVAEGSLRAVGAPVADPLPGIGSGPGAPGPGTPGPGTPGPGAPAPGAEPLRFGNQTPRPGPEAVGLPGTAAGGPRTARLARGWRGAGRAVRGTRAGRLATRHRLVLAGVVVVGLVAGAVPISLAAFGGDPATSASPSTVAGAESTTPASPTSAPPTYRAGIDPCLLGTWRVTSNQAYGLIDDVRVLYTGGAGTVVSYRADGTYHLDYNKMKPRTARYRGATWSDVYRGTESGRYHAENGVLNSTATRSNLVDTLRRNGKVNATSKGGSFPEPANYRCSGKDLYTYSPHGNFANEMVRVGAAPS